LRFGIPWEQQSIRFRVFLSYVKQQFESAIHVELLMAVEERETFQGGRYIDLVLYEALHKHCVLYDAGRGLAIHARQFEAVAVEVDGMGVVGLVIEHQAVAPPLCSTRGWAFSSKAAPLIVQRLEAAGSSVDFAEDQGDGFIGWPHGADRAELRIVPWRFGVA
jgi:hypothetical protein